MKPPPYDYVRRYYSVDPVVGARVRFTESRKPRFGVIAREPGSGSQYVYVHFDGERHAVPCHPTSLDYNPTEPTLVSLAAERDALKAEVEALRGAVEKQPTERELHARAACYLTDRGWKPGDQLSIHSVLECMKGFVRDVMTHRTVGEPAISEAEEEADLRGLSQLRAAPEGRSALADQGEEG